VVVGAYYYPWWGLPPPYENKWKGAVKGTPFLGKYNSSDSHVADQHIILARQHKIDFFAVSWFGVFDWYDHVMIDSNLNDGLLKAQGLSNFKFCLLYETEGIWDSIVG
jgi:hypothetical protein